VSYLAFFGVDAGRGAAVEQELHGLYACSVARGDHQHSLSILHDKVRVVSGRTR
jgi:hypothetical protein